MSSAPLNVGTTGRRIYIGKLAGTSVFDPLGEKVGVIHDVVVTFRLNSTANVIGFVVEVGPRKRVFLPFTRVTAIESGSVITTGLLNIRSFNQRPVETLVITELFDREVTMNDGSGVVKILDVAMQQRRPRDWIISTLHVQRVRTTTLGFKRGGTTMTVRVDEVSSLLKTDSNQAATALIQHTEDMKAADLADFIHDLPAERQLAVATELPDSRLADVLEELGEDAEPTLEYSNLEDAVSMSRINWDEGFTPSTENPADEATPYTEAEDRLLQKLNLTREDISEIITPW